MLIGAGLFIPAMVIVFEVITVLRATSDCAVKLNGSGVVSTPAAAIVMDKDCEAVLELASLTVTVKVDVAAVVGVPEITPVAPAKVKPAGRVPTVTAQVYGEVPPVAASV